MAVTALEGDVRYIRSATMSESQTSRVHEFWNTRVR